MGTAHEWASERPVTCTTEGALLLRRMVAMDLSVEAVSRHDPELLHELNKSCSACRYPELCASGLRDIREARKRLCASPDRDDYCPIAGALNALSDFAWFLSTIAEAEDDAGT